MRLRVARRSSSAEASWSAFCASFGSVAAVTFLIAVLMRDRCARLCAVRFRSCRILFSALDVLAKRILHQSDGSKVATKSSAASRYRQESWGYDPRTLVGKRVAHPAMAPLASAAMEPLQL